MEKSVSLDRVFTDVPFYERFALAARAGFANVEIGVWTELDVTRVADELRANTLRLVCLDGNDKHDLSRPDQHGDFMEYLSQSLAVAKLFGCNRLTVKPNVGLVTNTANAADTTILAGEDLRNAAIATRVLMSVAQRAQRMGFTFLLKPAYEPGSEDFLPLLRLSGNVVGAVNSPALRLVLDATELWRCQSVPEAANVMRRVNQFVGQIHIGEHSDPADWQAELAWFKKNIADYYEYKGYVGLLYPATQNDTAILDAFRDL